jgi:pSer/pThr/pTyr-binding forkhead associated (FHA) protein
MDLNVQDRGSTNGTAVNGVKIAPSKWVPVSAGDTVVVGTTAFLVVCDGGGSSKAAAAAGAPAPAAAGGGKGKGKK